jgi:hypothetical protein
MDLRIHLRFPHITNKNHPWPPSNSKFVDTQNKVLHIPPMPGMLSQIIRDQQKQVEKIAGTSENIRKLVRYALDGPVPVMPLKNSPETGIITIGLPVPVNLRERLLKQKERYYLPSYKAAIMTAIRIGVEIMEKTVADDV